MGPLEGYRRGTPVKTFYTVKVEGEVRPCIADVAFFSEPFNAHVITRINVPHSLRGQGYGRQLMAQILYDADHEGVPLMLAPEPSDGLDFRALEAWYERCGFKRTRSGAMMERAPR